MTDRPSRFYTSKDGEDLKDKTVQCDEQCDGKPCGGLHNKPHTYLDIECFCECRHEGHHGFCVPTNSDKRL